MHHGSTTMPQTRALTDANTNVAQSLMIKASLHIVTVNTTQDLVTCSLPSAACALISDYNL
ncbi:hypothetical protein PAXRUDRAFT_830731, partial [Paxillus rubicundulus Ve08.2h10]